MAKSVYCVQRGFLRHNQTAPRSFDRASHRGMVAVVQTSLSALLNDASALEEVRFGCYPPRGFDFCPPL